MPFLENKLLIIALVWFAFFCLWEILSFVYKTATPKRRDKNWFSFLISVILITISTEYLYADYLLSSFEFPLLFNYFADITGIILILAGISFAVWARITLSYSWSGTVAFIENQSIVKNGPYAIVRHPIYAGVISMLWGSFLVGRFGILFLTAILGTVVLIWKARLEESLLGKYKSEEYMAYKSKVPGIF